VMGVCVKYYNNNCYYTIRHQFESVGLIRSGILNQYFCRYFLLWFGITVKHYTNNILSALS